jgi:hypothetical protein
MQVYRLVWGGLATLVLGPAVIWAVGAGAGVEMLVLGVGLALFAGTFVWVVAEDHPDRRTWVRRAVVWTAIGAPGADALGTTWGATGFVLAMFLLLTSPALVSPAYTWYVGWTSRRSTGPMESLSERDLRRRWDSTTAEVRHSATTAARLLLLVEERRRLLDEMECRDPAHFDSWVATAVPHDGPSRPRHRGR